VQDQLIKADQYKREEPFHWMKSEVKL